MVEPKICTHCGRRIEPRAIKPDDWAALKYCSNGCRRSAKARIHGEIEQRILALLDGLHPASSICPSDAARRQFPDGWRQHLEDVRRAARRLAHRKQVVITQKGRTVDPSQFRGPVRIGRGPWFPGSSETR